MTTLSDSTQLELPIHPQAELLEYLPCGLLVFNKPKRVLSHPNRISEQKMSIIDAPYDEKEECFLCKDNQDNLVRVYLLHRLDAATSGILLLAIEKKIALFIKEKFKERNIKKTYLAVVKGEVSTHGKEWKDFLNKDRKSQKMIRASASHGKSAITKPRLLKTRFKDRPLSLVELVPLTGRTHQLRVQAALRHHPILGDQKYGDYTTNQWVQKNFKTKRLFLHAYKLDFEFSFAGRKYKLHATADIPPEFDDIMLGGNPTTKSSPQIPPSIKKT